MYIPIIKNRSVEMESFKEVNYCFSEKIIPLVEIITDTYIPRYEIDPTTHKPLMTIKPGNKKASKVKLEPIENDKDTLQRVSQITKGELTFIDYFRYDPKKYGKSKIKITECELATSLSRDPKLYKSKVLDVCNYENLIPVISIKPNFEFSSSNLIKFIQQLQLKTISLALRVTYDCILPLQNVIEQYLRPTDYILFDIGEKNIKSTLATIMAFSKFETMATSVLLNSPRKAKLQNGEYDTEITDLINNSVRTQFSEYGFNGFGDYGGLKDKLPEKGGSNGTGHALAILYQNSSNSFYTFVNQDVSLGTKGYKSVINDILALESELNPENDCPIFEKIKILQRSGKPGGWSTWIKYTLIRYLDQIYKSLISID